MKTTHRILVAVFASFVVGCQKPPSSPPTNVSEREVAVSSTGESFFLEPIELESQKKLARQGDNRAALRVANHYGLGEAKPSEAYPWFLLAAERGDIGAMRSLGVYLSSEGGMDNCQRSVEWLQRAKREASVQEGQEYGITETLSHLQADFRECSRKR